MGLNEQMGAVDRLMRRPQDLRELIAAGGDVGGVLSNVDAERAEAVHAVFAELIVARWWQPRFPATVAALRHFLGEDYASWLVGQESLLLAEGEDLRGTALGGAVLSLAKGADDLPEAAQELPAWLTELYAYEYLLAVGLPRRAEGAEVDTTLEAALLPDAVWLSGGRLTRELLVAPFHWPVGELQEEPHETEPDSHVRLLWIEEQGAAEVEGPHLAGDVVDLLSKDADDATILAMDPDAAQALTWFRELGLLA
ncbi:MAG: hypothetical protein JKY65_32220 [Planctomycetes bacterium]|nr:hypothetical protein [Planctomycetota bacterium]